MSFVVVCVLLLVTLGVVAALFSLFSKGDDDIIVSTNHDCSNCVSADDGSCKLHCLIEEKKCREDNKTTR
jgi:hypothetical protein